MKKFEKTTALIGAGTWGKNLARNLYQLGALHTLCDAHSDLLKSYREVYPDVHLESNLDNVLSNPEIKQVMIAAPAIQHYVIARKALLAGKDIYVEKPLCMDSREAEELIHLAESSGRILMVGHLLHYHPCVKKLQEIVANGELGKLQYITSNRLNLGAYRMEENALWNFAPHDISVILSLCGHQLPQKVRCVGADYLSHGVADTTMLTMTFAGNIRAHVYVSWLNPFKEQKMTVVGTHGMAVFDDTLPWGQKLVFYRNHVTWLDGNIPRANKPLEERIDPPQLEPLKEECIHFLECCRDRVFPLTDGHEGLRTLYVLQAAQESLNEDGEAKNPLLQHQTSLSDKKMKINIHPSATVDPEAVLGSDVQVWHYTHIMKGAQIGARSKIGQNVFISDRVKLGSNVKVQNNVSIYAGVTCEDDVFLGPSMVFTNILNPRSEVVRRDKYISTLIKKGATIGANATILCGVTIGEYAFIGAGAVVTKDVPPFALMMGNPARQVGWMSRHGERLDLPVFSEGKTLEAICAGTGRKYTLFGTKLAPEDMIV